VLKFPSFFVADFDGYFGAHFGSFIDFGFRAILCVFVYNSSGGFARLLHL